MTNALFICGKARMRSPTAADIAAVWPGIATDFAGLSADADEKLGAEQIVWADIIFVMEARQAKRLQSLFGHILKCKKIVILNIPDRFDYMDPELITLLNPKLRAALHLYPPRRLQSCPLPANPIPKYPGGCHDHARHTARQIYRSYCWGGG